MSRSQTDLMLGTKPDCTLIHPDEPQRDRLWRDAMHYAHNAFDLRELRKFAVQWLDRSDLAKAPDYHFAVLGKLCWAALEGAVLSASDEQWIQRKLEEIDRSDEPQADSTDDEFFAEPTARQRDMAAYVGLYAALDQLVTAGVVDPERVREIIEDHNPKSTVLRQTVAHFKLSLAEAVADGITAWVPPLTVIDNELDGRTQNNKLSKQANRKLGARTARVVQNVKFKSHDSTYNLVSVNPADIIGAQAAVTFNTKTKRVNFYVGSPQLEITGTTIRSFDEKLSFSKNLRNPIKDLASIKAAGAFKRASVVMDQHLGGKRLDVSGRINEDTVIVKTF